MEALIGTVVGAVIAAVAMLLNAHFTAKRQEEREERAAQRLRLEKDLSELNQLYHDALRLLDRVIRRRGLDAEEKLETLYAIETKLRLIATLQIYEKFIDVKGAVYDMAHSLTPYPDRFVPSREGDDERMLREAETKKIEKKREKEAEEFLPEIHKKYRELSEMMREDLESRKQGGP